MFENNRLVQEAKAVERTPRGFFLLLQILMIFMIFLLFGLPFIFAEEQINSLSRTLFRDSQLVSSIEFALMPLATVLVAIAVAVYVRVFERRPLRQVGFSHPHRTPRFVRGFAIGAGSVAVIAACASLVGLGSIDNSGLVVSGASVLPYLPIFLVAWVIQGTSEEIFTQGWLMPKAVRTFGPGIGVGLSSAVFSLLHLWNDGMGPLPLVNLLLFGLFGAGLALYEEGISGIAGYHAAWNFAYCNLFGFPISGSEGDTSFVRIVLEEHLLAGSSFGPMGGLLATFLLLVQLGIVGLLLKRKHCASKRTTTTSLDCIL